MPFNVELTEEETLCLHQYFERVDETEDLSFLNPAEYLAFQRIAGQVCRASTAVLKSNYDRLIDMARRTVVRGFGGDMPSPRFGGGGASQIMVPSAKRLLPFRSEPAQSANEESDATSSVPQAEVVVRECLAGFDNGDVEKVIDLFSVDARIVSPLHGCQTAREFLPEVLGVPGRAKLTLHDVLTNIEGRPQAVGYFLFGGWQSASRGEALAERQGVFHYVLNIDLPARSIQSMIVL